MDPLSLQSGIIRTEIMAQNEPKRVQSPSQGAQNELKQLASFEPERLAQLDRNGWHSLFRSIQQNTEKYPLGLLLAKWQVL